MRYFYNPPLPVKLLFSDSVWHSANEKILLTFDDGPLAGNTEIILSALDDNNIKAVFFCVGNNLIKNPALTEEIISRGHTIGNHTMNHRILESSGNIEISSEIFPVNNLMQDMFGYRVKYFRPPHGRYSFRQRAVIKNSGLKNVMWSLLTYDYKNDLTVVKKSLDYLTKNSVVVFHDSLKSSGIIIDSLRMLIETAELKNIQIGTPEECLS